MFNIFGHRAMIADVVRSDAYARAIGATVTPRDTVIDLGTGTGIFAILAARAGARRVFAIESGDIIAAARELARVNGCEHAIEFLHADSRHVQLPERTNVLVADIRGVVPFFATSLTAWIDVRDRLLVPNARVIPQRDVIRAALVESPSVYMPHDAYEQVAGIDLRPLRRLAVNHMRKADVQPGELLSEPHDVAVIDYATLATPDLASSFELCATRSGIAHGFVLWFDATLADGIAFSNAPGEPETIYGRLFVPFERPVEVQTSDAIAIDLHARLVNDDDYLWRWTTSRNGARCFDQSTFFAYPHPL